MFDRLRKDIGLFSSAKATTQGRPSLWRAVTIILTKAEVHALLLYRFYHSLHKLGLRLIPELLCRLNLILTGAEIDPGAEIGGGCRLFHPSGVVIGRGVKIGENVTILQGVTLGGSGIDIFDHGKKGKDGYPVIEDDVWLFAGAKALGPISVGKGSLIGANVLLTRSVPEGSKVVLTSKPLIRKTQPDAPAGLISKDEADGIAALTHRVDELERQVKTLLSRDALVSKRKLP